MQQHDFDDRYQEFDTFDDDAPTNQRMRRLRDRDAQPEPNRRGRLTEDERVRLARAREDALHERPPAGDRWSTWGEADHGPAPYPDWVITELAAVDHELGVLKTGKEADVHLVRREIPHTGRDCVLAAKRYRSGDHRLFHRDAGYLEGRRMRRSRESRAMSRRSAFGRNLIAEQWAAAEFAALGRLWAIGAPVPYPVQRAGTELLLEFVGDDDGAAPRLAQLRPDPDELDTLWHQLLDALVLLTANGLAHGDLSAFNMLVHKGKLVLIDLPQVVDLYANPRGREFLERDVRTVTEWFRAHGVSEHVADQRWVLDLLDREADAPR